MDSETPLTAFRRLVMAEPMLQDHLSRFAAPDDFIREAQAIAVGRGMILAARVLEEASRPDPLGLSRFMPPALAGGPWPEPGWLPARSVPGPDGLAFDWLHFGMGPLAEPFFEDSVRHVAARPLNRLLAIRHTLDDLVRGASTEAPAPAGFVFHLSRCGSTLLTRLLASYAGHAKISEAEPLDAVVQWAAALPPADDGSPAPAAISALRAMTQALMRNLPRGTRAFFKLDCWHIAALPLFRAAFPDVPWVFLYRDPVEVAVSQLAMPGVHVVPGMSGAGLLGFSGDDNLPREDYVASVLGRICALAAKHARHPGGMLLDYSDVFSAMATLLPRHFGFTPDTEARQRLDRLAGDNAKHPGQPFHDDASRKQSEASASLRKAIDRYARPHYDNLNYIRLESTES